jgi:TM2 domain-containing membrane protein YozV
MNSLKPAYHFWKQLSGIFILLCFVYSRFIYPTEREIQEEYKDPILAGALSWYTPGMGQLYVGKTKRGVIIFITEWTLILSSIFVYADVSFSLGGKKGISVSFTEKEEYTDNPIFRRKTISITLLSLAIALHIYNVVDAIRLANEHNKSLIKITYNQHNDGNKFIGMSINNEF